MSSGNTFSGAKRYYHCPNPAPGAFAEENRRMRAAGYEKKKPLQHNLLEWRGRATNWLTLHRAWEVLLYFQPWVSPNISRLVALWKPIPFTRCLSCSPYSCKSG